MAYFKTVSLDTVAFEPVAKHNKMYVANLTEPLVVQTPPVRLASALGGEEPFALLKPTGQFAQFLKDAEAHVLEAALQHKADWFRRAVDDEALRHNFKSFFRDGEFKVKVQGEVAVFGPDKQLLGPEEAVPGACVRCVLELTRVCFGRQEFGAMWRLLQAQVVHEPECLIVEEPEDDASEPGDDPPADAEEQEFM